VTELLHGLLGYLVADDFSMIASASISTSLETF
jgi:hypothetical protein